MYLRDVTKSFRAKVKSLKKGSNIKIQEHYF